ncbi:DUF4474 domain-containing protein [Clostridium cellulovorans]|uniref:DUF4474 domain-containing protein n=1 Tax=Clostridium cellulovorans (strain ATCC 35296 / DSM 3052 / OCM 3 / 743B) TaxID=573061 RepID=D9SUR7_CLOC7|nr:DUF4474 domain-containing protein [Clostridium cellulovorans]ADL50972.1 hypothetical protein Clocel_1216 [Clostridium cellulovorans 743B]
MFAMGKLNCLESVVFENKQLTENIVQPSYYAQFEKFPALRIGLVIIIVALIIYLIFQKEIKISILRWKKSISNTKNNRRPKEALSKNDIDRIMSTAGYAYNPIQDIFYSITHPWQREMGYCHFYDEAAPILGLVIDCEPIKFMYKGELWLIELWKGQYGMTTGCEIGVYKKAKMQLDIPRVFKGNFYDAVEDFERLDMKMSLIKDNKEIFRREGISWWLTGFKLGMFSHPSELIVDLSITLKDLEMRNAFIMALIDIGYLEDEIYLDNNTVTFQFNKPRTKQPTSKKKIFLSIVQSSNKLNCRRYQKIAGNHKNFYDAINAIEKETPDLFDKIINLRKFNELKNMLGIKRK